MLYSFHVIYCSFNSFQRMHEVEMFRVGHDIINAIYKNGNVHQKQSLSYIV